MKWLCFGAGALGTYLGGSLALAGDEVTFLERQGAVDDLRHRGLRLDFGRYGWAGNEAVQTIEPIRLDVENSLEAALDHGPFDVGIYALKSFDTAGALESMAPFAAQLPPICCFSNGVDNEPALAGILGADRVIPATVTTAIGRRAPGDIIVEKLRGVGIVGLHPLSKRVADAASAASLRPRLYSDPTAMKWSKLFTNLVANPSSAILDMTAAQIFADRDLYCMEIGMLRECLAVMRAQGIVIVDLPGVPVRALALVTRLPAWLSKPLLARGAGGGRGAPRCHLSTLICTPGVGSRRWNIYMVPLSGQAGNIMFPPRSMPC